MWALFDRLDLPTKRTLVEEGLATVVPRSRIAECVDLWEQEYSHLHEFSVCEYLLKVNELLELGGRRLDTLMASLVRSMFRPVQATDSRRGRPTFVEPEERELPSQDPLNFDNAKFDSDADDLNTLAELNGKLAELSKLDDEEQSKS